MSNQGNNNKAPAPSATTTAAPATAAAKPPAAAMTAALAAPPAVAAPGATTAAPTQPAPPPALPGLPAALQAPPPQHAALFPPPATFQPRFPFPPAPATAAAAAPPAAAAAVPPWAQQALPPPPPGMNHEAALRYERTRYSAMELNYKNEINRLKKLNEELEAKLKRDVQYERTRFNAMELNYKCEIQRLMKQNVETETKLKCGELEQQKLSKSLAAEKKTSAKRKAELSDVKERARKVKKGIPYTKYDAKWNMRYEQLKAYKEANGNCNLSKRLHRNTQYKELASWVTHQRYEHKCLREGKYTSLNPTRVKLLTQLGFEWRVATNEQLSWDERFMQLLEFQAINGHTRVPQKHDKPPGLGHWVLDQRKYYKHKHSAKGNKILTDERIKKMEAIGFEWSLRNHTKTRAPSSNTKPAPPPPPPPPPPGAQQVAATGTAPPLRAQVPPPGAAPSLRAPVATPGAAPPLHAPAPPPGATPPLQAPAPPPAAGPPLQAPTPPPAAGPAPPVQGPGAAPPVGIPVPPPGVSPPPRAAAVAAAGASGPSQQQSQKKVAYVSL